MPHSTRSRLINAVRRLSVPVLHQRAIDVHDTLREICAMGDVESGPGFILGQRRALRQEGGHVGALHVLHDHREMRLGQEHFLQRHDVGVQVASACTQTQWLDTSILCVAHAPQAIQELGNARIMATSAARPGESIQPTGGDSSLNSAMLEEEIQSTLYDTDTGSLTATLRHTFGA